MPNRCCIICWVFFFFNSLIMNTDGWIKIHRSILEWQWYGDTNVTRLFIHLLLSANYTDREWQNMTISAGQLVTSISSLADQTNLSIKQIRGAIKKLVNGGEIVTKGTNKYTIITICKYDSYQNFSDDEGKQRANKGQH